MRLRVCRKRDYQNIDCFLESRERKLASKFQTCVPNVHFNVIAKIYRTLFIRIVQLRALVCTFTLGLSILFVDVLLHHLHLLRIGKTIAIVRFDSFFFFSFNNKICSVIQRNPMNLVSGSGCFYIGHMAPITPPITMISHSPRQETTESLS